MLPSYISTMIKILILDQCEHYLYQYSKVFAYNSHLIHILSKYRQMFRFLFLLFYIFSLFFKNQRCLSRHGCWQRRRLPQVKTFSEKQGQTVHKTATGRHTVKLKKHLNKRFVFCIIFLYKTSLLR